MSFYVSWSGLGSEYPGLKSTASLPPEGLDEPGASHLEDVDSLIAAWAEDHADEKLQVTLSGHAQEIDTGTHSTLSLNLTTTPAVKEETPVDVSKSQDPFAPDEPAEQAEKPAEVLLDPDPQQGGPGGESADSVAAREATAQPETTQQPAEPAPVNTAEGQAASENVEDSAPQQNASQVQAIASAGENPTDATPPGAAGEDAVRPPEVQEQAEDPQPAEASASEPTSDSPSGSEPSESAGPTEPEIVSTDPAKPGELPASESTTTEEDHDAVS